MDHPNRFEAGFRRMKRALTDTCLEARHAKHIVPIVLKSFMFERMLGSGSQGEVWLARRSSSSEDMAIKLLPITTDAWNELRAFRLLAKHEPHVNVLHLAFSATDKCVIPLVPARCTFSEVTHIVLPCVQGQYQPRVSGVPFRHARVCASVKVP